MAQLVRRLGWGCGRRDFGGPNYTSGGGGGQKQMEGSMCFGQKIERPFCWLGCGTEEMEGPKLLPVFLG